MKNGSTNNQLKIIISFIIRYDLVIFIIITAVGLVGSIYVLTGVINQPYSDKAAADLNSTAFDQATINKLLKLETSSKNVNYDTLPPGRIDPFSE